MSAEFDAFRGLERALEEEMAELLLKLAQSEELTRIERERAACDTLLARLREMGEATR